MSTVLVTGANRGIGLEFARQYATDGWKVIATCRLPDQAEALIDLAKSKPGIRIEPLNVNDGDSVASLSSRFSEEAIDVLINNAGILTGTAQPCTAEANDPAQSFGTIDAEAWMRILQTNTVAPVMLTQALFPQIMRGTTRKIAMISSGWGSLEQTGPEYMGYRSSKAALNAAMRSISEMLRNSGVILASLSPGWVRTDMGGSGATLLPEKSVAGMRKVIADLTLKQSGGFFRYNGEVAPW
ncbi:MAG: SDR family oxidoreductase [Bdellovibrionales bacterium]